MSVCNTPLLSDSSARTADGFRALRDSPWELRIDCSRGMLNWDVFFYWPTQRYPNHIYGGVVEGIADWAYVHE